MCYFNRCYVLMNIEMIVYIEMFREADLGFGRLGSNDDAGSEGGSHL